MVNIAGLDKAEVLAALVNGTVPIGLGALYARSLFSIEDAQRSIDAKDDGEPLRFDYVNGCPIKCDISGDTFEERLYDRDAGIGAAERAITALRNDTGRIGLVLPEGQKFDCPFCAGKCEAVTTMQVAGVLHSLPPCDTFEKLEPDEFLRQVNEGIRRRN